jgi:hypothetical protein
MLFFTAITERHRSTASGTAHTRSSFDDRLCK